MCTLHLSSIAFLSVSNNEMIEFCIIPLILWPNFAINFGTVNENTIKNHFWKFTEWLAFEKSLILKCLLFGSRLFMKTYILFAEMIPAAFSSFRWMLKQWNRKVLEKSIKKIFCFFYTKILWKGEKQQRKVIKENAVLLMMKLAANGYSF